MKKFKKLIPALCMLLVSAVMLGSTTFAWFSMNKTVTATGMEIKAEVPTQLLISHNNTLWGNTMTLSSDSQIGETVAPVTVYSINKGETLTNTFYKMTTDGMKLVNELGKNGLTYTAANIANIRIDGTTEGTAAKAFETTEKDYYQDDIYLKLSGKLSATTTENKVKATAKITNKATAGESLDAITNALRLVIVDGDSKVLVSVDCGAANTEITVDDTKNYKTIDLGEVFEFVASNKDSQKLTLFAFYYGEDDNCYNNNATDVDGLNITIDFTLGA